MDYLVSVATKSVMGLETAKENMGADSFANGDQTTTVIKTANGRTILLQHNVYTPRPYDRMYQVVGTKGYAEKYPTELIALQGENTADGSGEGYDNLNAHSFVPESVFNALMEEYKSPIIKDIEAKAKEVGGHGGMDFIMDYRLVWCLRNGRPLDMDVYDAAEWSCIGELTGASIENGSKPVRIPDFTRGKWQKINGFRYSM